MSKNGVSVGLYSESYGAGFGAATVDTGIGSPVIRLGERYGSSNGNQYNLNPSQDDICWYSLGWMQGEGTSTNPWYGPDPISPTEHSIFYQIVQKFQTTLGRQV